MADFNPAIERTIYFEIGNTTNGGYVNDPDDPGRETKYGISKRAYPEVDIKKLTRLAAGYIYRADYWNAIKGNDFLDRYQNLAETVFDFAVNAGVRRASKYLQTAINSMRILRIRVDGHIGWITIGAVHQIDQIKLLGYYNHLRLVYYRKLARKREKRKYLYSWIRRITDA